MTANWYPFHTLILSSDDIAWHSPFFISPYTRETYLENVNKTPRNSIIDSLEMDWKHG